MILGILSDTQSCLAIWVKVTKQNFRCCDKMLHRFDTTPPGRQVKRCVAISILAVDVCPKAN